MQTAIKVEQLSKKLWQSACNRPNQSIRKIRHRLRAAWRKRRREKYND